MFAQGQQERTRRGCAAALASHHWRTSIWTSLGASSNFRQKAPWVYTHRRLKSIATIKKALVTILLCFHLPFPSKTSKTELAFRRTAPLNGRAQHERCRTRARDERQLHAAREASRKSREPVLFQNGWETNSDVSHWSPLANNPPARPSRQKVPSKPAKSRKTTNKRCFIILFFNREVVK